MYTMRDLESWTNIPRRTIHYWVSLGILPRPSPGGGITASYPPETLRRIREIQRLRDQRMTLADLRDHFNPETDA